jgi:hypothetical protein
MGTAVGGVLALAYRVGTLVGRILSKQDEHDRRLDELAAEQVAQRNGYRPR